MGIPRYEPDLVYKIEKKNPLPTIIQEVIDVEIEVKTKFNFTDQFCKNKTGVKIAFSDQSFKTGSEKSIT